MQRYSVMTVKQEETSTATTCWQLGTTNMLAGPPWCCGWEVVEMHLDPRRSTQKHGDLQTPPFLGGLADTRWLKFRIFATTSVWNVYTSHIYISIIMCTPLSWMLKFNFVFAKCYVWPGSKSYFLKTYCSMFDHVWRAPPAQESKSILQPVKFAWSMY